LGLIRQDTRGIRIETEVLQPLRDVLKLKLSPCPVCGKRRSDRCELPKGINNEWQRDLTASITHGGKDSMLAEDFGVVKGQQFSRIKR
jgi:hypothetical protein